MTFPIAESPNRMLTQGWRLRHPLMEADCSFFSPPPPSSIFLFQSMTISLSNSSRPWVWMSPFMALMSHWGMLP